MNNLTNKTMAMAAALILGAFGEVQSHAADTNATTVAYWQFNETVPDVNSPSGSSFQDLGTNLGQGTVTGGAPNLWVLGPINGNPTFSSAAPPSSLFNANHYYSAGSGSWDVGADEYYGPGAEIDCDNTAYGDIFDTPSFSEEVIFKTDYTNDPTLGTVKQTLVWNHQNSAFCHLQLNESAAGNTNDIGSLLFWGWDVLAFTTCRVTAAQNGGHRLDDGQWHYAVARFDATKLTMDLLVVNQDGTSAESTTYLGAPLNPGGSGSQGPLIIGNDENEATPFDGLINQVRFSSAALPDSALLANVTGCNAPTFTSSPVTNLVAVGSALNMSPAYWPVQMEGGPLLFQWQLNGQNLVGQTNLNLSLLPVALTNAGSYQLVASTPCGGLAATSAPVVLLVSNAINIAQWDFQTVILPLNDATPPSPIPQAGIASSLTNWYNQYYPLITFNNSPLMGVGGNGTIGLTNLVPPTTMFINGNSGGTNSFDASFIEGVDGVVFYPNGSYPGDPFDFQTSFSLEVFFMTYGNQSTNGTMELICQGSDGGNTFSYGVNLNQSAPGALSFRINNHGLAPLGPSFEDTNAGIQSIVVSNANYADGNWHYAVAKYDSTHNKITLSVANQDGTGSSATQALPTGYSPLAAVDEGNLFVGRYRYPHVDGSQTDPRTFIGAISDVQVSAGLVTPSTGQLGYLPQPPFITGIKALGGSVVITFTGNPAASASAYSVLGSSTVNGAYTGQSATVVALGGGNFQATIAMSGSTQFYIIKY